MVAALTLIGALALAQQSPQSPFETLPAPTNARPFVERLAGQDEAVWLDGDTLTFVKRAEKGPVRLMGGIDTELKPLKGTDLWVGRFKRAGWERGFLSYTFVGTELTHTVSFRQWRGAQAPPSPPKAKEVKVVKFAIKSEHLGESREVSVFVPSGAVGPLPAFVMADGQSAEVWAQVLQALIDQGKVRPAAIVGIHSAEYRGERGKPYDDALDFRAKEYLPNGERFAAHLAFVEKEVLPEVARRFGVSTKREDLCVTGFSNGGAFAAAAAFARPDLFGAAVPLSVGIPPAEPKPTANPPRLFFAAGELEPGFLKGTRHAEALAKKWGATTKLEAYLSGHDPEMWSVAFARFAPEVFPPLD